MRQALVLLAIAGGMGGVVAGTRHRIPPTASVAFADTGAATAKPVQPLPPTGPRLPDGGAPDILSVGSSFDEEDKLERYPVTDHEVTRSIFDDLDKTNPHPTGP